MALSADTLALAVAAAEPFAPALIKTLAVQALLQLGEAHLHGCQVLRCWVGRACFRILALAVDTGTQPAHWQGLVASTLLLLAGHAGLAGLWRLAAILLHQVAGK
jgi:hypothetical protein